MATAIDIDGCGNGRRRQVGLGWIRILVQRDLHLYERERSSSEALVKHTHLQSRFVVAHVFLEKAHGILAAHVDRVQRNST